MSLYLYVVHLPSTKQGQGHTLPLCRGPALRRLLRPGVHCSPLVRLVLEMGLAL